MEKLRAKSALCQKFGVRKCCVASTFPKYVHRSVSRASVFLRCSIVWVTKYAAQSHVPHGLNPKERPQPAELRRHRSHRNFFPYALGFNLAFRWVMLIYLALRSASEYAPKESKANGSAALLINRGESKLAAWNRTSTSHSSPNKRREQIFKSRTNRWVIREENA